MFHKKCARKVLLNDFDNWIRVKIFGEMLVALYCETIIFSVIQPPVADNAVISIF